jgi:hypothetical protein
MTVDASGKPQIQSSFQGGGYGSRVFPAVFPPNRAALLSTASAWIEHDYNPLHRGLDAKGGPTLHFVLWALVDTAMH